MSDSPPTRRQPPSPLVFYPDKVIPHQSTNGSGSHGSGTNTVTMPFVRRHVTRRLKSAKAECDKELQRVTDSITAFFEERLREGDHEREADRDLRERERDRDSQFGDPEPLQEPFVFHPADLRSALQADESSSDGGYEAELESSQYSRDRAFSNANSSSKPATLTHWSSSPGLLAASSAQSLSPSLRRQSTLPWERDRERQLNTSTSSSTVSSSPSTSTAPLADGASPRKQPISIAPTSWGNQSMSSRRLSRTIHIPVRPSQSGQSSRSTSRSRSPMPLNAQSNLFDSYTSTTSNRRSSRILVDDPIDPIMSVLYAIIGVATDVMEITPTQLTAQPKLCEGFVQRVQNIGKAWEEHPDWQGRNWYVQMLLAIASLSRVVEWWEAEKQFWNFDDNDDEEEEPFAYAFIAKPVDERAQQNVRQLEADMGNLKLAPEDDNKLRLARPSSQGRKSRDEQPKNLSLTNQYREDPPSHASSKIVDHTESARVLATERLRLQAEMAQNQNIVVELSLDGDHFIWINYAWRVVVGTDPDELPGTRISRLLAPSDLGVFREATQRLQEDDSHTVEVRFRLQVEPEDECDPAAGILYQQMEGKGMLMVDREDGQPSHTMWVVKPIAPARYESEDEAVMVEIGDVDDESYPEAGDRSFSNRSVFEPITPFPFNQPISVEPILCRICECQVPQWYFEKHSETCVEVHRLEAEIAACNESISELRSTIRDLAIAVDRSSPVAVPEYRGMAIFSPSTSPSISSPMQLFRPNKIQRMGVKMMQRRLLEQLEDILQVASEVAMPSLKDEESKEPIERQRLLSPSSERKITQIRNWCKPNTEDAALGQLVQDAERVMRQKADNVIRMQNTIRYSEKIWNEWEEKVAESLAMIQGSGAAEADEHDDDELSEGDDGDHSSATSEYVLTGDATSSEPTPMASSSPVPFATENRSNNGNGLVPMPPPVARQLQTRSSTPSSISSPLALAEPIIAPSSHDDTPPPMTLDDIPRGLTIKTRKSVQNLLEPKLLLTPPHSPMVSPRDVPTTRRGHRRQSTAANPLFSPTIAPLSGPLSPRQPSSAPLSRTTTSIKDFDVIKPISKGAFGSVFLAKKKATGDYYAIKVLKKADMIAKNQITNVKAERMILMTQAESPFVAKLYFTFMSKENLYLVMEYLNGGDCAALIKSLGSLPEEWTKNYIAEVVLGLEYLHQRGVVHRDLKPDNLLINQQGHLKLTDFGLSRIGLLGRQTRETQLGLQAYTRHNPHSRPPSMDSTYLSSPLFPADVIPGGSYFNPRPPTVSRPGQSPYVLSTDDVSESSGSESVSGLFRRRSSKTNDSPLQSFATELTNDLRSHSHLGAGTPPNEQKFVGTPDYLAPETILGLSGDDATVDWWALGVITYEFLYGIPPFHAETPEKVFENILSGHVEWHQEWIQFTPEARDFMERLLTIDPSQRLGAGGAEEVKAHPFFNGIEWDKVTSAEAAFIPQISDPESTDYFDPRGAVPQMFHDEDQVAIASQQGADSPGVRSPFIPSATLPVPIAHSREGSGHPANDDFGSFSFKNLPILKQANDDLIRKLKTDQMAPLTHTLSEPSALHSRRPSISQRIKKPPNVVTSLDNKSMSTNPPSPTTSTSSIASSPSMASQPPSTPASIGSHLRKPSEYGAVERFKLSHLEGERRNSMPSRLRTASVSSMGDGSGSENWPSSLGHGSSHFEGHTPPSSVHSIDLKKGPDPSDRAVTCLLAEDNPITAKIIETLLIRLACRCVVVSDGSEAISVAMGDIKFDCILMDVHMPVLDGEAAARYIKSTNSKNTNTPIIAISAYSGGDEASNVFAASLSKPLQKADLLTVMRQLGFKTSTRQGPTMHGPGTTKLTMPIAS